MDLKKFLIDCNIPLTAGNRLLHILHPYHPTLPLKTSTLLSNTQHIPEVHDMAAGGEMVYFSVAEHMKHIVSSNIEIGNRFELVINIDGLPLYNSSNRNFWPILGKFHCSRKPFVISIFCGEGKPPVLEFLSPFIDEMRTLQTSGICIDSTFYKVNLKYVVCDAPARAFVKCIKCHSGYSSCDKCLVEGEWQNKVVFLDNDAPLRNDSSFRSQSDEEIILGFHPS